MIDVNSPITAFTKRIGNQKKWPQACILVSWLRSSFMEDWSKCGSIFRQDYSWGRFRCTIQTFETIFCFNRVFSSFLQFVHAFGFKTNEDRHVRDGYCRHFSEKSQSEQNYYGLIPPANIE